MKTLKLFFFFFIVPIILLQAQITKGNWLVGGSGDYTSQNYKYDNGESAKINRITIKPNAGYFLEDKFAIGSNLRFEYQDIFYTYGVGLFSRYYFLETQKTFNLFAQLHGDYVYTVSDIERQSRSASSFFYGLSVGQVIFLNSVVGLEFAIEYERGKLPSAVSDNFKAVIGFQFHLEKK